MEGFESLVPRICEVYDRLASVLAAIWGKDDVDYRHCEQFVLDFVKKQKERELSAAQHAQKAESSEDEEKKKIEEEGKKKEKEPEEKANEKVTEEEKGKNSPSTTSSSSPLSSSVSSSTPPLRLCGVCGIAASHRCSRCKAMYYCSAAHQREHWKVHKPNCNPSSTAN